MQREKTSATGKPAGKDKAVERYLQDNGARRYQKKYERTWARRLDNAREHRILQRLVKEAGRGLTILNAACGAGRFAGILLGRARFTAFTDLSKAMLHLTRQVPRVQAHAGRTAFLVSDALHLPFQDRSVDLAMAIRLLHHIHDQRQARSCLLELMRVSRGWVIVTFADGRSLKGRHRRLRQRYFGRKPGEAMLSRHQIRAWARSGGFHVCRIIPVSRMFSTQTYALLERSGHAHRPLHA